MKNDLQNALVFRQIIIGRNSKIWSVICSDEKLGATIAVGHSEVASFDFKEVTASGFFRIHVCHMKIKKY